MASAVSQTFSDYEIIVIVNASSDRTLMLAREFEKSHPKLVQVVANQDNVGLGEARNQGLELAIGRYVAFLDGDDWINDNALSLMYASATTYDSEVTVVNHARFFGDGTYRINRRTDVLKHPFVDTHAEKQLLLNNLNVAWNKLYLLSFIKRNNFTFERGYYEDIDWNFKILLIAKKISCIADVLYYYRQRTGSILNSVNHDHIHIIDRWENLFKYIKNNYSNSDPLIGAIHDYMTRTVINVLAQPGRLPNESKAAYFTQAKMLFERVADFKQGKLKKDAEARYQLIKKSTYARYKLYDSLERPIKHKGRRALNALMRKFERRYGKKLRLSIYRKVLLNLPLQDNWVVFESQWGRNMNCNPYAIFEEISKTGKYRCAWVLRPDVSKRGEKSRTIRLTPMSLRYLHFMARAKYFVNNANFPTELEKRPGTIHLQTMHGTPLKSMGLAERFNHSNNKMDWKKFQKRCSRWDYVLSTNTYSNKIWRRDYPYGYKILETGYPRNDVFFRDESSIRDKLFKELSIPRGKIVILYAPTFRDDCDDNSFKLDLMELKNAVSDSHIILLRSHYLRDKFNNDFRLNGFVYDVSDYPEANELACISDILITDYSSIMFDYANKKKPIILFGYDYDKYKETRGVYFDIKESAPGPFVKNNEELIEVINNKKYEDSVNHDKLNSFHRKYCQFDNGDAAKKVVNIVFE